MTEEEMVRWILSACNPRLASGLGGVVSTVEQLVKVGSLIKKDWSNSKDYWSRMQQGSHTDRTPWKTVKKSEHGWLGRGQANVAAVVAVPSLLVVPVGIQGSRGDAVLDTGSTHSLMSFTLWMGIKQEGESLSPSEIPKFTMANGQGCKARGRITLLLSLQDTHVSVCIHVLDDGQLCMPLLLGLDFMCTGQIILKPHTGRYVMAGGREYKFLQKTRDALQWGHAGVGVNFYVAELEAPTEGPTPIPLLEAQPEVVRPLLQKWSTVWTESKGTTSVIKHKILTTDELPVRRRAYRVSQIRSEDAQQWCDRAVYVGLGVSCHVGPEERPNPSVLCGLPGAQRQNPP